MQVLDLDAIPYQRAWAIVDMTQPRSACHNTPSARDWQALVSYISILSPLNNVLEILMQCFARIAVLDLATTLIQLPLGLEQVVLHLTPS